jgi:hypothetical protein
VADHPAPLTPAELAEIEARERRTTAGPWELTRDRSVVLCYIEPICAIDHMVAERDCQTAEFVAASRADVPRLLATVAARDAEIEALRGELRASGEHVGGLTAALRDIATPRASVDMADPEAEQERDALHALGMVRNTARRALAELGGE